VASATSTDYSSAPVIATRILDQVNKLRNAEVTEASTCEIAISVRILTEQCNARYLKDIRVDSMYTPTNAIPTEIKSWYFSDLNFNNIQKYIIDSFENLERNSYNTQIEISNQCIDTLSVLIIYLNLIIFSRLTHGVVSILTILMTAPMIVHAGEPPSAERCYDAGYSNGQNAPFIVTTFQECDTESKFVDGQNQYQEGFLDGCLSIEGNTREICETAIE
jgi:hypothetical protein